MTMLPPGLQIRVDAVPPGETRQLIEDILRHFGARPAAPVAAETVKDATVFRDISLVLPERRRVQVAISKRELSILVGDSLLYRGDWTAYTVLLCLPLPDRPKPQWNVVLSGSGETLVFSLGNVAADKFVDNAKPVSIREAFVAALEPRVREAATGPPVVQVAAHLGSKEGVLAFLDNYVLFGYRKPLLLLPLASIRSVSYTVITRLTFNLLVSMQNGTTHEFLMIPHEFYEGINEYVVSRGLENSSLAEERRAKRMREEPSALQEAEDAAGNSASASASEHSSDSEEAEFSDEEDDDDDEGSEALESDG